MSEHPSHVRAYRVLGTAALSFALALLGLWMVPPESGWIILPLQVGLTLIGVASVLALLLHTGRSARRLIAFALPVAILLLPSLALFRLSAPYVLGFPIGVSWNPVSMWEYASAYQEGRAEAKKDLQAGLLAMQVYGFGAGGGNGVQLIRDRYQVETRAIAQCEVNAKIAGRAAGYNSVSEPEIYRRVDRATLERTREEGYQLDSDEQARRIEERKALARQFTSLSAGSNIRLEAIWIGPDEPLDEANLSEADFAEFIHGIERIVARITPPLPAEAELRIHGDLIPAARPTADTSASAEFPTSVYFKIREDLGGLPDVRPTSKRVYYHLTFSSVRDPAASTNTASTH